MDIYSKAYNSKYINRYIDKGTHTELHITNLMDIDYIILIDSEDVEKCKKHFWSCMMTGRQGYKKERIYCYVNKEVLPMSRLLLEVKEEQKVIFKNKDCLDFRKSNLYIVNPHQSYVREDCGELPTSITKRIQPNGKHIGFYVDYFDEQKNYKRKYFGIKKYGTLEVCLQEAIEFKQRKMETVA